MISVVIPYFQREHGVLRRALASIAAQRDCPLPLHVIVVDDASPVPAAAEVSAVGLPCTIQVLTRINGGPGAARNTGLDHALAGTRFIAFLDSDDEWSPDHLARAVHALQSGFDFYFADLYQLGQSVGAFARAGRIRPAEHPPLPGPFAGLHAYKGDMLDQIIRGNVVGTSTVVYDFTRFGQQRFRVEFTNAGEDYLFWMALAHGGAKVAFSSAVGATYGKGVNVYSGAGWGTDQHLSRLHNELKFKKTIGDLYPIDARQKAHIAQSISDLRKAFARDLVHRVRTRKQLPISLLASHLRLDPLSFLQVPVVGAQAVFKGLGSR